ncbi:hypothetical protein [Janthinobacterium violaceinigrum]|uniref:DUF4760 domain-containing protein n=1 Tax=Janthinobacterium violaceinigrum TaxID=2654252 RepID=A0A6I1I5K2_9BURK|nr:hypothetical protein [Janthinobacterium violaceinigrum]KAB8066242.1 hypothetical protein GCN75_03330 [Janthinobacterium violaceinigrum]
MKYPYLTVALLGIFGVVDIVILGNHYQLTKSDWSGWVQAIGSIAALGVAIFVMSRQNAHSAKLLAEADVRVMARRAAAVSALVVRASERLQECTTSLTRAANAGDNRKFHLTWTVVGPALRQCKSTLEMVPAHELGGYKMANGLHCMIDSLHHFLLLGEDWEKETFPAFDPTFQIAYCEAHRDGGIDALNIFNQGVEEISN